MTGITNENDWLEYNRCVHLCDCLFWLCLFVNVVPFSTCNIVSDVFLFLYLFLFSFVIFCHKSIVSCRLQGSRSNLQWQCRVPCIMQPFVLICVVGCLSPTDYSSLMGCSPLIFQRRNCFYCASFSYLDEKHKHVSHILYSSLTLAAPDTFGNRDSVQWSSPTPDWSISGCCVILAWMCYIPLNSLYCIDYFIHLTLCSISCHCRAIHTLCFERPILRTCLTLSTFTAADIKKYGSLIFWCSTYLCNIIDIGVSHLGIIPCKNISNCFS